MNTADIKRYAPQARRDFIAAVSDRAAMYGLTAQGTEPVTVQGDVAIIAGRAYPKSVAAKRARLEERVQRDGFLQAMGAIAYAGQRAISQSSDFDSRLKTAAELAR